MTLTFELDLDILPLDLHGEIQVHKSVRSAVRVRQTDRITQDAKTITPVADAGCNYYIFNVWSYRYSHVNDNGHYPIIFITLRSIN